MFAVLFLTNEVVVKRRCANHHNSVRSRCLIYFVVSQEYFFLIRDEDKLKQLYNQLMFLDVIFNCNLSGIKHSGYRHCILLLLYRCILLLLVGGFVFIILCALPVQTVRAIHSGSHAIHHHLMCCLSFKLFFKLFSACARSGC
jgi:hypothetical protein